VEAIRSTRSTTLVPYTTLFRSIGLSKARRAGVKLPPPKRGSAKIKKQAARDLRKSKSRRKPSRRRSRAVKKALKRESRQSGSRKDRKSTRPNSSHVSSSYAVFC